MIENYKYVIFDFDGTLVDSMQMWQNLDNEILGKHGIVPDTFVKNKIKTLSITETAAFFRTRYTLDMTTEELVKEILDLAAYKYENEIKLKPYVKSLLSQFRREGVKMCIATASTRKNVEKVLNMYGIRGHFDFIVTGEEVDLGKEHPQIYLNCADRFGVKPEEILVFEDVYHAVLTASNAGFNVIAVYDECAKDDIFKISQIAYGYINDFSELLLQEENSMKKVLTIAGSDCSGGAGIQADIKTITAHKLYASSVITALTAQNTTGVYSIIDVTPEFVASQMDAVFRDIYPDAVKIGMVSNKEIINVIADKLIEYNAMNIVLDPVMISTSGNKLLDDDAIDTLVNKLMPLATLITPNIFEAEILSGITIETKNDMIRAASEINKKYRKEILIKGGHLAFCSDDLLFFDGIQCWFEQENISNENNHGTGCTLSSAIASNLALEKDMATSISDAKEYITGALKDGLDLGKGKGPLNHCWWL